MLIRACFSVDDKILQHMVDSQAEFIMEVTDKTKADIKVCILVDVSFHRTDRSAGWYSH